MKFLFPVFIIFVLWLAYELKKHENIRKKVSDDYWDREKQANLTRKKNIDDLNYITIPLDTLPFFEINDTELLKYQDTIRSLASKKILNLSNISNTALKLEYGTANITFLSQCDSNFSTLLSTLLNWAKRLLALGYVTQAITILEYGIACGTDLSKNYYLLAAYYKENGNYEEIERLLEQATKINSLMRDSIVENLKTYLL